MDRLCPPSQPPPPAPDPPPENNGHGRPFDDPHDGSTSCSIETLDTNLVVPSTSTPSESAKGRGELVQHDHPVNCGWRETEQLQLERSTTKQQSTTDAGDGPMLAAEPIFHAHRTSRTPTGMLGWTSMSADAVPGK